MPSFKGDVDPQYWFDPIALMGDAVGLSDERYIWWASTVGRQLGITLVDLEQLCSLPPLAYPAMTTENINALGLKEIFRLWMLEYLYSVHVNP